MQKIGLSVISLLLILTACKKEGDKSTNDYQPESVGITFTDCETQEESYTFQCGYLAVPENRDEPESRLITLPFKIIKSSNPTGAPIFFLNGGPGASNLDYRPDARVLEKHDVVLIGYRGVDGMSRLHCDGMFQSSEGELFSEAGVDEMANRITSCVENLENNGFDLAGYTMVEVIDDIEYARQQLNYDRLHLVSGSYGTRLAQIYAYRYPESISRSLLVSVNPPGHFVWEPETIDRQISYYAKLCSKDPHCKGQTEDLAATIKNVMHNMPERWLFFPIDRDKVRMATFMGLYHRGSAASVFDVFIQAEKGDASGLALVSMMFDFQISGLDFSWGDLYAKAYPDFDPKRNYGKDMAVNQSIMGSPGSQIFASMYAWPGKALDTLYNKPQKSDVNMLLLSGNVDFSTPAEFAAEELMPYYSNARHVVLSEIGHTGDVMWYNREAYVHLAKNYFDSGVVDTSLFKYEPMVFEPDMKFAKMAKIGLAIGILVIVLVPSLIWFIVRFIRRRRRRGRMQIK